MTDSRQRDPRDAGSACRFAATATPGDVLERAASPAEAVPVAVAEADESGFVARTTTKVTRRRRRDTFVERTEPLVLVVSPDAATGPRLQAGLQAWRIQIATATRDATAITQLRRLRPDAVLLESGPGPAEGLALCVRMQAELRGECIPVVLMVPADDVEAMARAREVGATSFVTTPVDTQVLAHLLRCTLHQAVAHEQVRRSEARFRQMVDRLDQVFLVTSDDGREIIYVSQAYEALTGRTCRSLLEEPSSYVAAILEEDRAAVLAATQRPGCYEAVFDYRVMHADGQARWVHEQRYHIIGPDGRSHRVASLLEDVTERRRAEEEIRYLADFDAVTALPNRSLFKRTLARALVRAERERRFVATLFLDLDHFKRVNDTLGHPAGDALLAEVAERLRGCVRTTDAISRGASGSDSCTVARLGGDEFTVLLDDLEDLAVVSTVARRILSALREPFRLSDREVFITCSIGASVYPRDGADVDALLKSADVAMYCVKDEGRDGFRFYNGVTDPTSIERLSLSGRLRAAIEHDHLLLHYQPQIDTATGAVIGLEALVRWNDGKRLVLPGEFIPLAEETGLIIAVGEWVLQTACEQAVAWQRDGLRPVRMSVNLSSRQVRQPGFAARLGHILHETGLPPERLELELTESVVMSDAQAVIATLQALRLMGVHLAIDDFGTGYSSLNYLRRLPITALKIDRSFVRDIPEREGGCALVRAIIALAQGLGLALVAEGVERPEQLAFLRREGCHVVQGFLCGGPRSADEAAALLRPDAHLRSVAVAHALTSGR